MKLAWIAVLGVLLVSCGNSAPEDAAVFVLIGQSNMAGRAPVDGWPGLTNGARVWVYRFDRHWTNNPAPPIHAYDDHSPAFAHRLEPLVGPGLSFADALASETPVALIPCALHGSWMREWREGGDLYTGCRERWEAASVRVAGVLVYQGESDAQVAADARQWGRRFGDLVSALRRDISPDLPVVFAQIGAPLDGCSHEDRFASWRAVREQQAAVNIPGVAMIRTDDLTTQDDCVHLDLPAQIAVGQRFADAMLSILEPARTQRTAFGAPLHPGVSNQHNPFPDQGLRGHQPE